MSRPPYPHRLPYRNGLIGLCKCGAACSTAALTAPVSDGREAWYEVGTDCPAALHEHIAEQNRHIASLDCRFAGHFAELSGKHCPPGQPCDRCEAEARAERAEAERDAARKMLAECYRLSGADPDGDGWEHLWQTAVDEVRELRQQHDEMRRESRADTDKAVAAALEARAKELDARAEAAIEASDKAEAKGDHYRANSDAGRWAAFQAAARIVRGA